jgi:glycosyltransferase involved in cell wall biosynthesis
VILLSGDFPLPPYGGIAAHVVGLGRALQQDGHTVRIVAPEYGARDGTAEHDGLTVERVRATGPRFLRYRKLQRRTRARLHELAAELEADVLHVHDFLVGPPAAKPLAARLPVVFTNHTSNFLDLAAWAPGRFFLRRLIGRPVGVVSVSPDLHEASALLLPARRELIPSGVDPERFHAVDGSTMRAGWGIPAGGRVVLYVGRIHPIKGLDRLLEALVGLDARLVVVGDGLPRHEAELRQSVEARGLRDRVLLAGRVGHAELPACYAAADVVCLPSRMEATSLSGLEAMACGRPLVVSAVGGLPLIVEHERNGLLVPVDAAAALGAALARVLDDRELARRLGTEGRRRAREEFSWSAIATRTAAFYRDCIEHAGSGRG